MITDKRTMSYNLDFKSSISFILIIVLIYLGVYYISVTLSLLLLEGKTEPSLNLDGDFYSLNYLLTSLVVFFVLHSKAKANSFLNFSRYFALRRPATLEHFVNFTAIYAIYYGTVELTSIYFGFKTPPFIYYLYETTDYVVLGFIAVMFCAPFIEELIFRGYLYQGWRRTGLGNYGTIALTSVLFTLFHLGQSNLHMLGYVFVFGLLLGAARYKSSSLYLPIYLHFLNNVMQMVQLGILVN